MKNKINAIALLLIFTATSLFAQTTDFDLSKYKLPYLKRSTLDFDFRIKGYNYGLDTQSSQSAIQKSTAHDFNNNLSLTYTYYLNSPKFQKEYYVSYNHGLSFQNQEYDNSQKFLSNSFSPQLYGNLINRMYGERELFFEYGIRTSNYMSYSKQSIEFSGIGNDNRNDRRTNVSLSVPLGIGKGRIEQVQDARQAIYIYNELAAINRVTEDKSDEDILEFARLISELKNERFFDSRLKRIYELERIDSFMVANNFITQYDGSYFAVLNDYWMYGSQQTRLSGQRFSLTIVPEFNYINNYSKYNRPEIYSNEVFQRMWKLDAGIDYTREKPINLTWQNSINAFAFGGLAKLNSSGDTKVTMPNVQAGFSQNWGYYPNTRTSISLGYSLQYLKVFNSKTESNDVLYDGYDLRAETNLNISYYFSPQLRLSFANSFSYYRDENKPDFINNLYNGYMDYSYNFNGQGKSFSNYYSLRLTYSFF